VARRLADPGPNIVLSQPGPHNHRLPLHSGVPGRGGGDLTGKETDKPWTEQKNPRSLALRIIVFFLNVLTFWRPKGGSEWQGGADPGLVVIISLTLSLHSGVQRGGRSEWQGDGQTVDRTFSLCSLWLRIIVVP
jgi:hypothetical protein